MEAVTLSLLAQAAQPDDAPATKAFHCLRELRRACVEMTGSERYNTLLDKIKALWLPEAGAAPTRETFWAALAADADLSAGKISRAEVEDSPVSPEEAKAFLLHTPAALPLLAEAPTAMDEEDDFADLE
jgi:hypothetical protein